MPHDLPLHGVTETLLPAGDDDAVAQLRGVRDRELDERERGELLRGVAAAHPTLLAGWAELAEWSLERDDPVAAYAFARVGYHRGLDAIRRAGWKGQGAVPWAHEPNRGFLRSVHALMRAAVAIGEDDEAERCKTFLSQLDPDDALDVRD
ncbi:MAG: DUF3151 domain-containing protein [Egibacteraceae bacterium]